MGSAHVKKRNNTRSRNDFTVDVRFIDVILKNLTVLRAVVIVVTNITLYHPKPNEYNLQITEGWRMTH